MTVQRRIFSLQNLNFEVLYYNKKNNKEPCQIVGGFVEGGGRGGGGGGLALPSPLRSCRIKCMHHNLKSFCNEGFYYSTHSLFSSVKLLKIP